MLDMWVGTLVNGATIVAGGLIGTVAGRWLPERVRQAMPQALGLACLGIGGVLVTRGQELPAVALAFLLGTLAGELLDLEGRLERGIDALRMRLTRGKDDPAAEGFVRHYITVLVLFCASGMGIFGALREGLAGDSSILLAKAVLDFFSAIVFASQLGIPVAFAAIPMLVVQCLLALAAAGAAPLVTPAMLADFTAVGGLVMLATGLRVCGIRSFAVVNMLPALLLAMPCTVLWAGLVS